MGVPDWRLTGAEMTEGVQIALIASVAPTIAAVGATIAIVKKGNKIQEAVREVHISLNSRLTELVAASKAQGRQDERDSRMVTVEGMPKDTP